MKKSKFTAFNIDIASYGAFRKLDIYATDEILQRKNRNGDTIEHVGFQYGKHLLEYLTARFGGKDNFKLYLTNTQVSKYTINDSDVTINLQKYRDFTNKIRKTKDNIPEVKFGLKLNIALGKTQREIGLLVPKYFFNDKEKDLQEKIGLLPDDDVFNLILTNFSETVKRFNLFDIDRKKAMVKAFENSSFETAVLKSFKKLSKDSPEKKFKEFLAALENRDPKEVMQVIKKISAAESSNSHIRLLNEKMSKAGSSLKDQKKIIEDFDMVSALAPRIKNLKKSLKEFRKLINTLKRQKNKDEAKIHSFLVRNYWLLGIEYYSKPKKSAINEFGERTDKEVSAEDRSRPDIIIESVDGSKTAVFFELEEVKDKVIHRIGKKETGLFASDMIEAINQAVRYTIQAKLKGKYPKGKVVVGTIGKNKKWKAKFAEISEYLGNIEILTYDDLIEKAQKTIDFFENYEKNSQ